MRDPALQATLQAAAAESGGKVSVKKLESTVKKEFKAMRARQKT